MVVLTPEELAAKMDSLSRIKKLSFRVSVGVLVGISVCSALARAAIRLRMRQGLWLDDYLLFFAALLLIATAGFMYYICDEIYLATVVRADSTLIFQLPADELTHMIDHAVQENAATLILAWTATFFVKFSFLAFFKMLIRQVAGIKKYYWGIVIFTIFTWLFLICEPFILCPHFGIKSLTCFDQSQNLLYVSMTGLITGLDVLTDVLIVTIPIFILRRVKMRLMQKIALGTFLCLSLMMAIMAIIRVSGITGVAGVDIPWTFFWQFTEASVAVLMGSLTAFRTLLVGHVGRNSEPKRSWPYSRYRIYKWGGRKVSADDETQEGLPEVPGATMTGLRTFIRRNNRDPCLATANMTTHTMFREPSNENNDQYMPNEGAIRASTEGRHAQPTQSYQLQDITDPRSQQPVKHPISTSSHEYTGFREDQTQGWSSPPTSFGESTTIRR
ncbi:unnamed protein product [Clonostachys rhizophaga]|uniref:Rhodopsin domain-containing protein n=1 Tax=Clonostachys rhizophaga TaxID=160324 RepID=A0A9N9VWS7_9HYPO|nr:unnamed protein product [Clonostachys rhizophaga]